MNSLSFSENSLWIHYSLFQYLFREATLNHFQFRKFTIFFANWLCINYILHWITMNQLTFFGKTLSICYLCRVFVIFHPNSPWIREKSINEYLFREITMNSLSPKNKLWFHHLFREITMNSLSWLWNHFEFTFTYANSSLFCEFTIFYIFSLLWLHYLLRQQTMYLLSFPLNHYLCRESTMNLLSLRDSIIVFPNVL